MKTQSRWMLATLMAVALSGCDDYGSDHNRDVPEGKGSMIVDNRSADEIDIFIDGHLANHADGYESKSFDLTPRVHRIVLEQTGGSRSFRDDIDIIEGKRTVLDVSVQTFSDEYDVAVFFD